MGVNGCGYVLVGLVILHHSIVQVGISIYGDQIGLHRLFPPTAATVVCGQMPQHLRLHREAILVKGHHSSLWLKVITF